MVHFASDSVYEVFGQVIRSHYRRMHVLLDRLGVYPGQPPLLSLLGKHQGLSQRELAETLHLKAATITVMLNRMAKSKLIERRHDPADHRVSKVYLTGRGRKVRDRVRQSLKTIEAECFLNFTAAERRRLHGSLRKMRDNLTAAGALE